GGARAQARRERRRGTAAADREDELSHAGPRRSRAELRSGAAQVLRRFARALRDAGARDIRPGLLQPERARRYRARGRRRGDRRAKCGGGAAGAAKLTRARAASFVALAAGLVASSSAFAHRLSPAFFGLTETAPGVYAVQWKVSLSGGLASALEPKIPAGCTLLGDVRTYVVNDDVRFQHGTMSCPGGVAGRELAVDRLDLTQTDVLLRVDYLDGTASNQRLTPAAPRVTIPARPSALDVIR